ncbi:hypothetical protein C0431_06050 [bacterium]|jgi:hypothetical protein|nr:hypothetical protein [bacterium]
MTIWEKMQKVDRRILYAILVVCVCVGLFFPTTIPTDPDPSSKSFYAEVMKLEKGSTVIIQTDWTNSTRGESMGHFENLMRLMMHGDHKFVFYSAADPAAPQVARTVLARIVAERKGQGLREYKVGEDYIDLGFFPNAEATNTTMGSNLRSVWANRKSKTPTGGEVDVWQTPVLKDVKNIGDVDMMIVVTASASIDVAIQRLAQKVPITAMVTGVTGPGVLPFYQSGQVKGLAIGLKGVYDVEYMMVNGINDVEVEGKKVVEWDKVGKVDRVNEGTTFSRGRAYYGTLHVALVLLILAVVMGNVAMFASRRRKGDAV